MTEDFAAALGLPRNRGEIVQSVVDGEAAARSGIEAGDVVVSVNGREVTPDQTLSFLVANIKPGTTVPVELIRDGKRRKLIKYSEGAEGATNPYLARMSERSSFYAGVRALFDNYFDLYGEDGGEEAS